MQASIRCGNMATGLHRGRNTLGRQIDSHIRLYSDPGVSRRHCVFVFNGTELRVENLSDTATLVNGTAISESTALAHGDTVQVGSTQLQVELIDDEQVIDSPTSVG